MAHGYVGGRAATFPLQYLGWDVDNINTVNFSNHTGYGHFHGTALQPSELTALFNGLKEIHCKYQMVVLGYIPSSDLIDIVAAQVSTLKASSDSYVMYICDTVMGDQGLLYVEDSCVQAYRRLLSTGVVDVITPNQFELELLYGLPIKDESTLRAAIAYMHYNYNICHIVVSSLDASVLPFENPGLIYCAVSSRPLDHESQEAFSPLLRVFAVPEIKSYFTGVGDLFTALLADKITFNLDNVARAVNQVLTIMSQVLRLTHQLGVEEYSNYAAPHSSNESNRSHNGSKGSKNGVVNGSSAGRMNGDSMRFFELRIVQARRFYDYNGDGEFVPITL